MAHRRKDNRPYVLRRLRENFNPYLYFFPIYKTNEKDRHSRLSRGRCRCRCSSPCQVAGPWRDGTDSLLSSVVASGRAPAHQRSFITANRDLCFPFDPFWRVFWFGEKKSKQTVPAPRRPAAAAWPILTILAHKSGFWWSRCLVGTREYFPRPKSANFWGKFVSVLPGNKFHPNFGRLCFKF